MTRTYDVGAFKQAALELGKQLTAQLDELAARRQAHQARLGEIRAQHAEVLAQLTRHLLPDLSAAACERAGKTTAFTDLMNGEPARRLAADRDTLQADVAAVDADQRYRERDVRRARITTELDEIADYRGPLAEVDTRAAHPRLDWLLQTGYDTEAYTGRWWRASYYADWKAGDEIVERFPTKASFSQVREEVLSARQALAEYDERARGLTAELAAIDELERRRAAAAERLAHLDELHLQEWRQRLGLHVAMVDPAGLADRLGGETGAELLLKTLVGTGKKIEYLEELARTRLDDLEQQLHAEQQKLSRDKIKYSRPKNAYTQFPAETFERRFRDRGPRFAKHWRRYDHTYDTIYVFDGYHRASFYEDFLWWDLMTDGRIDGNFIREVDEFHRHHPGYRWEGTPISDEQAAAATLMADRTDDAATAAFDPS